MYSIKKIGFKTYDQASSYVRKKYKVNGWIGGFGAVSINTLHSLKKALVTEHSLEEINAPSGSFSYGKNE